MPETMSPELLLAATRGPQVETLGDAFARMRANRDAEKSRKQQLTLGDISTEEGQLKLKQLKQDAQLDQERRQAMRDIARGVKPAPVDDAPQPGSPQLAPTPMQAPGLAAPQQSPMQQPAPMAAPQSPFAADEAFIANRRAAGDFRAADAAEQALLKRKLDTAAASKDSAQAFNDEQTGHKTAAGLRNEAYLKVTTHMLGLSPGQRAAAWPQFRDELIEQGHIDKAHVALTYPGDDWLMHQHGLVQDQANIEAVAKAKREADLAPSQLAKAKTEADQAAKINAGTSAMGITAEQKATADQTAKRDTSSAKNAAGHLAVDRARLDMQQKQAGFEMNGGVSDVAKGIATGFYDAAATKRLLGKNPGLISQIKNVDPDFSELNIDKRQDVLREFTSSSNSKAGGQVTALNTLVHHAGLYKEIAAGLKNGSFRPGNALYNKVATMFGSAPPIQANLVAGFLAGETGKVATGGVPAEGEIHRVLQNMGNDGSPEQMDKAGDTLLQIAAGRMVPLQEKADDAQLGKLVKILGPDAQEILSRNGYDPKTMKKSSATVSLRAPDGSVSAVPADQVGHYLKMGAKRVQ